MFNDKAGRICRPGSGPIRGERGQRGRESGRILVVDPILGSRLALAEAVSQPGFRIEMAPGFDEALRVFATGPVDLVLADLDLGQRDGLSLLGELRRRHPEAARALVANRDARDLPRRFVEEADLCFLLRKPWRPEVVRRLVRRALGLRGAEAGWTRIDPSVIPRFGGPSAAAWESRGSGPDRRHEVLSRGLLAGLNACETQSQVFELLRGELDPCFDVFRWLWLDEEAGRATRIRRDRPMETDLPLESLRPEERRALECARPCARATRLDDRLAFEERSSGRVRIGLGIGSGTEGMLRGVVWVEATEARRLTVLLGDLHEGLRNAARRIHAAEARSRAARQLARRVSEELRSPVGALAHAIDRLRGEAERAGVAPEWMERISSESRRVMEAVEHLEGEMFPEKSPIATQTH